MNIFALIIMLLISGCSTGQRTIVTPVAQLGASLADIPAMPVYWRDTENYSKEEEYLKEKYTRHPALKKYPYIIMDLEPQKYCNKSEFKFDAGKSTLSLVAFPLISMGKGGGWNPKFGDTECKSVIDILQIREVNPEIEDAHKINILCVDQSGKDISLIKCKDNIRKELSGWNKALEYINLK